MLCTQARRVAASCRLGHVEQRRVVETARHGDIQRRQNKEKVSSQEGQAIACSRLAQVERPHVMDSGQTRARRPAACCRHGHVKRPHVVDSGRHADIQRRQNNDKVWTRASRTATCRGLGPARARRAAACCGFDYVTRLFVVDSGTIGLGRLTHVEQPRA